MQYIAKASGTGRDIFATSSGSQSQCYESEPLPAAWRREDELDLKKNETYVEAIDPSKTLEKDQKIAIDAKKRTLKLVEPVAGCSKRSKILDDFFNVP